MATVALRTSLIWRDEVMEDFVLDRPAPITIGTGGAARFTVPDIGLPRGYAIVRPGNRGYLLTLGERMRGTICIDGREHDVAEFVRRAGGERIGGFHATPISGRDWGVIDLDETGDYKLFFQFVPVEDAQPFFTKSVLLGGLGGYLATILVLTSLAYWKGVHSDFSLLGSAFLGDLAECMFRAFLAATVVLGICGVIAWVIFKHSLESQLSLVFSIVMHLFLLFVVWVFYVPGDPFVWPGPRNLTAQYLASRIKDDPPEPPKPQVSGPKADQGAAAPKTPDPPKVVKTKGAEGKMGGEGEHERARDKTNLNNEPVAPPRVALFEDRNVKVIDNIIDRNLSTNLSKFQGILGETKRGDLGFGTGHGTGVGPETGTGTTRGTNGHGPGGGGNAEMDVISNHKDLDTGGLRTGGGNCAKPPCGVRPKEVKVSVGEAEGDLEGLTAEEINRVVKSAQGLFRACYQKELNRSPGLGGKLVMHFVIGGDGIVKSTKTGGGSSLRNDSVEECVNRQIMRLHFPAKGGISNVNYPFIFQPGG
jgi:hypothetical protein